MKKNNMENSMTQTNIAVWLGIRDPDVQDISIARLLKIRLCKESIAGNEWRHMTAAFFLVHSMTVSLI